MYVFFRPEKDCVNATNFVFSFYSWGFKNLASTGVMTHRDTATSRYGENIFHKNADNISVNGAEVTLNWYQEIKFHDFNKDVFNAQTGHFTQVIWRDSQRMGVGVAFK